MAIKFFHPYDGDVEHPDVGLIMVNHLGSSVRQDTGRDAQFMANRLGIVVVGVDRPGTARPPSPRLARRLATTEGYLAQATQLGNRINQRLLGSGLERLVVTGRSAGGLGALALARSGSIDGVTAVLAAEAIGFEDMTIQQGSNRYKSYKDTQAKLQYNNRGGKLVVPEPPNLSRYAGLERKAMMVPAFLTDKYHNQHVSSSRAAFVFAEHLAAEQTDIEVTLAFAGLSLVVTDEIYTQEVQPLQALRDHGAPFVVERISHTTHASFDNRDFMEALLQPVIDRVA